MRRLQYHPWPYYSPVDNWTCLFPTVEGSGQYSYNAAVRSLQFRAMTWSGDIAATDDPYSHGHCAALTFSDTGTSLGDIAGTEFNGCLDRTESYFGNFGSCDDGPALGSVTLTLSAGSATPRNDAQNRHPLAVDKRTNTY